MRLSAEHLEFYEAVRAAPDAATAWALLMGEAAKRGFEYAKYGFVLPSRPEIDAEDIVMFGHFSDAWEEAQETRDWMRDDYIVEHLITRKTPLTFAEVYQKLDRGELTPGQAENHAIGRDLGMDHGVALPLRDGAPTAVGGISFCAFPGFGDEEFTLHLVEILPDLKVFCELFHAHVRRPSLMSGRPLSGREKECLLWLIRGERVQQIAHRFGTHVKTVEKQMASARVKLGAKTNIQAASRALILGLINP